MMTREFTEIITRFFVNQVNLVGTFNTFSSLLYKKYIKVVYRLE